MTKDRLLDMKTAFQEKGWELANYKEMYSIEDEHLYWRLVNKNTKIKVELEFYLVGFMGEISYDLRDLCWCSIKKQNCKQEELHFSKRNTDMWREDYPRFVFNVIEYANKLKEYDV